MAGGWEKKKKKAGRGREIPEGTGLGVWEKLLFWAPDRGGKERPGWSCSAFPLLPLQLLYGTEAALWGGSDSAEVLGFILDLRFIKE